MPLCAPSSQGTRAWEAMPTCCLAPDTSVAPIAPVAHGGAFGACASLAESSTTASRSRNYCGTATPETDSTHFSSWESLRSVSQGSVGSPLSMKPNSRDLSHFEIACAVS